MKRHCPSDPTTLPLMTMSRTTLGRIAVLATVVIVGTVIVLPRLQLTDFTEKNEHTTDNKAVRPSLSGGGSATSGRLFSGDKVRSYSKRHFGTSDEISNPPIVFQVPTEEFKCARWSVVTTIFEPSSAVKKQAKMDGWCLVVVGDRKGPLACKKASMSVIQMEFILGLTHLQFCSR